MKHDRDFIRVLAAAGTAAVVVRVLGDMLTRAKQENHHSEPAAHLKEIDTFIEEQRRQFNIPGAALVIVEGDQIVHLRGFGQARPGGEIPSARTPFFIGSLTKSFTALAAMQLVEAKKLDLDAPVQRYLPWFRVADAQASACMTVRHLLNQTSGIPMLDGMMILADFDNRPGAAERQIRGLSSLKLNHQPGTAFEYSNLNYNILGLIIEACSSESYAQYIQKHIFNPLRMVNSTSSPSKAKRAGLAAGHRLWFGQPVPTHNLPIAAGSLAAGMLISTTENLGRYLIACLNSGKLENAQVVSPAGMAEILHPATEIHEMGMDLGSYAMGWIHDDTGAETIIYHSGIVPDYGGFMALLPGKKMAMALLYNANHAGLKLTLDEFGLRAAHLLAGQPLPTASFRKVPWILRGLLLIPVFQLLEAALTGRALRRWRKAPQTRPAGLRKWGSHIALPLLPHLLAGLSLIPLMTRMRGFFLLYAPDFSWLAQICGSLGLLWSVFRTQMVLRALGDSSALKVTRKSGGHGPASRS